MDDGFGHLCHSLDQDHRGPRQGRAKHCSQGSGEAGPQLCRWQEVGGGQGCVPLSQDLDKRTEVPSCPFHPPSKDPGPARLCEFIKTLHL